MEEYLAIRKVAKVVKEAYLGWGGGTFQANLFSDLPWKGGFNYCQSWLPGATFTQTLVLSLTGSVI